MLGTQIEQKFCPKDYTVFAGLDVDKKHIDVTFLDDGHFRKSMKMPYNSNALLAFVRRQFPSQRIAFAYEAGGTGFGLYDDIVTAGHACLVVAPSMVPVAPGSRVKTNRLDSRKLSVALRGGQLRSIHVPTPLYRHLRHLVQLRDTIARQRAALLVRIKALLLYEGLSFPNLNGKWTAKAFADLRALSCHPAVRFKLDQYLSNALFLREQLRQTMRETHDYCEASGEISHNLSLITSIPGIGKITGAQVLARIGDWRQLHNCRQLPMFLGLVPSESSTGDDVNRGRITRTGDARLRTKLIQAAWIATRRDPELRHFYSTVHARNPRPIAAKKAIVAVAQKLCRRISCVLMQQRPYVVRDVPFTTDKRQQRRSRERLGSGQRQVQTY